MSQSFEKERFMRAIDESKDVDQLRSISKTLLEGWFNQRAATQWVLRQAMISSSKMPPEAMSRLGFHP
ncbi:MAG: hypothetical protein ACO24H_02275 [Polynucleobacter sp.]